MVVSVIGGGLAGLVVASRLSEDEKKSILIIEAGENRKFLNLDHGFTILILA